MKRYPAVPDVRKFIAVFLCALCVSCPAAACAEGRETEPAAVSVSGIIRGRTRIEYLKEPLWFDDTELFSDFETDLYLWSVREDRYHIPAVRTNDFVNPEIVFPDGFPDYGNMAENRAIRFLVYDADHYYEGKAAVTSLPVVALWCDEPGSAYDWVDMKVWDNEKGTMTDSAGMIKIRGGTTRVFPKKSYRISLKDGDLEKKRHLSFLGMRRDDDWILYPAYNDQEKIRNVFCSNLWLETCAGKNGKGVRNGNEYRYVELFINDTYRGLYALGNPLDGKEMLSDGENAVLYKKIIWSDEMEDLDSDSAALPGYEIIKTSGSYKDNETACWRLLRDYYTFLRDNKNRSDMLMKRIDPENFIYFALFINLVQGWDNGAGGTQIKNVFLCLTDSGKGITSIIAPWDMDLTFGNGYIADPERNNTLCYTITPDVNQEFLHGYFGQILNNGDTDLAETIKKRYWALRRDLWSDENINRMIDRYEKDIYGSGAFLRDRERWPDGTYNDPEERLDAFRRYVMDRLRACDLLYAVPDVP
ncbi:MAG: CotH kinase family protein [Clostridia bacterium]|nr:CotH kinase family protein [Clostridia bacterium]